MEYSRDPLDSRDDIARTDRINDAGSGQIGDAAGAPRNNISGEQNTTLRALSDLDDLGIADGEPDIRGWTVRTSDGVDVGEVDDLIIDTTAMKVRYMCVELDQDEFGIDGPRRVLVPIGTARLEDEDDSVFITSTHSQLRALPPYDDEAFTGSDHTASHERFGRPWMTGQTASADDNRINVLDDRELYQQIQYDDRDFFGARRRDGDAQTYLRPRTPDATARSANNSMRGDSAVPRSIVDERLTKTERDQDRGDLRDTSDTARRSNDADLRDELR